MFARTACVTSPSQSSRRPVANSPSTDGRTRSTIARRLRDWLSVGRRSSSSVARMAPHCECPRTTTSRVPNRSAANSTLPTCEGATMLPATRMTKRSPSPWSKTISAGTRESEQPRTMAIGSWTWVNSIGRALTPYPWGSPRLVTNRWLPSRSLRSASRAEIIGAHTKEGRLPERRIPLTKRRLLMPVRVGRTDGARDVEPRHLLQREAPSCGAEILSKLLVGPRADHDGRDGWPLQQPVQRDLCNGLSGLAGQVIEHID